VARSRTISNLWRDAVAAAHPDPAYLHEVDGEWLEVTWAEAAQAVDEIANGLLALDIRKGDSFALLARTNLQWSLFDFALALVGAVGAPIYANSSPRDVRYLLEHSDCVGAFVEDDEQRAKVGGSVRHVISFAELDGLREQGRAFAVANPGALDERADSIDEDDLFTFIYTSGTTGPPKACMIRHRNYYAMVTKTDELENRLTEPGDVMLLYLPLAHNYGRLLHLTAAYIGYTLAFLPDPLRAGAELTRVRPTLFPSVPRVYEKIHTAVVASFETQTGVRKALVHWAMGVGYRVSKLRQAKQPVPRALALQHRLADRLVYAKVKARLGGRLRMANAGGAPLSRDIAEFFHALDILILEGYGLSEVTTAATVNRREDFKFGTVGKPLPGRRDRDRGGRRNPPPLGHRVCGVLPRRAGNERGARRRGVRPHRRRRPCRRGRLPRDHRSQEGHHRDRRGQERRATEPRERAEITPGCVAGARHGRPQAVYRGADHTGS